MQTYAIKILKNHNSRTNNRKYGLEKDLPIVKNDIKNAYTEN